MFGVVGNLVFRLDGAGDDASAKSSNACMVLRSERLGGFCFGVDRETVHFDNFTGIDGSVDVVGSIASFVQLVHDGQVVAARAFCIRATAQGGS